MNCYYIRWNEGCVLSSSPQNCTYTTFQPSGKITALNTEFSVNECLIGLFYVVLEALWEYSSYIPLVLLQILRSVSLHVQAKISTMLELAAVKQTTCQAITFRQLWFLNLLLKKYIFVNRRSWFFGIAN